MYLLLNGTVLTFDLGNMWLSRLWRAQVSGLGQKFVGMYNLMSAILFLFGYFFAQYIPLLCKCGANGKCKTIP